MTLKDLLYSSFDGDLSSDLSKDDLLSIEIHVISSHDYFDIVGSSFRNNRLDILL